MKFTYLLVDFFSVIIPLLFSFHPKIKFNRNFRYYFPANIISAFIFLVWDIIFTAKGIWGFNNQYTLGHKILNLPVEEYLFFFCIPFSCIFTYHCLTSFFKIKWHPVVENIVIVIFSFFLFLVGIINIDRLYTSVTFISTAALMLTLRFFLKVKWLDKFFTTYLILVIPFFIVNGILTGYGLKQPVVWYNDDYNLRIRLFTIPIEDIFYGMELLMCSLFFYERFKRVPD